jgi:hypothetical protein
METMSQETVGGLPDAKIATIGDSFRTYPKIYAFGHNAITPLFLDDVIVEEKVDGSQFSFGRFGQELKIKSKGAQINPDCPPKLFEDAVKYVIAIKDFLQNGWTYRGEVLSKPKHNVLCYDRVPSHNIMIFDVNPRQELYLGYEDKQIEASRLELETVPLLHAGKVGSAEELRQFLERTSALGGQLVEGVVVKNYKRFGVDGKVLMGKLVSERFKEIHKKDWKEQNPGQGDIIRKLIGQYKTTARWDKCIIHLKEQGLLQNEPKDLALLIPELHKDVKTECEQLIRQELFNWAWKDISRGLVAGFAEYYKQRLLEEQFK